jgi:hypothetical protein
MKLFRTDSEKLSESVLPHLDLEVDRSNLETGAKGRSFDHRSRPLALVPSESARPVVVFKLAGSVLNLKAVGGRVPPLPGPPPNTVAPQARCWQVAPGLISVGRTSKLNSLPCTRRIGA